MWSTMEEKEKNEIRAEFENEAKLSMWQNFKNFDKVIF